MVTVEPRGRGNGTSGEIADTLNRQPFEADHAAASPIDYVQTTGRLPVPQTLDKLRSTNKPRLHTVFGITNYHA